MSVTCSFTVEMTGLVYLVDEAGLFLVDQNGDNLVADGWVDISADVRASNAPTWTNGNSGNGLFDRVANVGTFSFALDNSIYNANGQAGWYSPDHNNAVALFGLDAKVRLTVTAGTATSQEWYGKIVSIEPSPFAWSNQATQIVCEDWMSYAASDNVKGITVQHNKRVNEILTTVTALASEPPPSTDFSTGDDILNYSLHDENSLTSSLMRIFQKLVMSDLGRINLVNWGVLTYRTRSELLLVSTPAATLTDTMTDLKISRTKSRRVKKIDVTTYPAQLDTTPAVLWEAQRELTIDAGETVTFDVSLRDPSGRATRIAATALETPIANTDYKFSSTSGSGNDLNGNLSITNTLKADIVSVSLTNSAGVTGYLWLHQIQGTGVYLYEPVTSTGVTGQPDGESLTLDMVYQDDPGVGEDLADLISYWYAADQSDVSSISFVANRSQELGNAAFLTPGDLVTIAEIQTGINRNYFINGTTKTMSAGNILRVTWHLVQANQITAAWFLEVAGFSELDLTTYLGA